MLPPNFTGRSHGQPLRVRRLARIPCRCNGRSRRGLKKSFAQPRDSETIFTGIVLLPSHRAGNSLTRRPPATLLFRVIFRHSSISVLAIILLHFISFVKQKLPPDEVNELSVEMKKTVPRENDHRRIFSIIQLVSRFFKFRYFQSVPELQGSSVP